MKSAYLVRGLARATDGNAVKTFEFCHETQNPEEARREAVHVLTSRGWWIKRVANVSQSTAGHVQDQELHYVFMNLGNPVAHKPGYLTIKE